MAKVTTVTKNVLTRDWNDLEPKLLTFLATGVTASGLILIGNYLGLMITAPEASLGVILISAIAGYIKKSSQTLPAPAAVTVTAVTAPSPPTTKPPVLTSTVSTTFPPDTVIVPPVTPPTV